MIVRLLMDDSTTDRIDQVAKTLDKTYSPRPWHPHLDPLDELIATVLSQHTSDVNTERAFRSLKAAFPDWESVRTAPTERVVEAIWSGGLAQLKAPRIQRILDAILAERGSLDLDHLAAMRLGEARAWLLRLDGVGPKTAACVLLFSLGMPAFPVDTHVHRVARRIGLVPYRTSVQAAHALLEDRLGGDRDRVYAFHLNLIAHGRAVCTARRPFCERCPLTGCCDYFAAHRDSSPSPPPPAPA